MIGIFFRYEELFNLSDVAEIMRWGSNPSDHIEWVESAQEPDGSTPTKIRFLRRVTTMHPDEIVYVRVIWLLCELKQIEWSKYLSCSRVVCITADSELSTENTNLTKEQVELVAFKLIKSINALERGCIYGGFKEAVIKIANFVDIEPLGSFLRGQAALLA
jgi:hypothetical protein